MKHSLILGLLVAVVPLLASEPTESQSPAQFAASQTQRLLTSLSEGDREAFIAHASVPFQEAMSPEAFAEARQKLLPILQVPAQLDFLGSLNKGKSVVFLYRLRPESGDTDWLVTTAIENGLVAGFFVN